MPPRWTPSENSHSKVAATGIGSEIPVDSITMWSNFWLAASDATDSTRSSLNVQQMQPLESSTIRSLPRSRCPSPAMSAASIFTSEKSLTITAILRPARLANKWLRSVVFPEPRNPDKTVTGVGRKSVMPAFRTFSLITSSIWRSSNTVHPLNVSPRQSQLRARHDALVEMEEGSQPKLVSQFPARLADYTSSKALMIHTVNSGGCRRSSQTCLLNQNRAQ